MFEVYKAWGLGCAELLKALRASSMGTGAL